MVFGLWLWVLGVARIAKQVSLLGVGIIEIRREGRVIDDGVLSAIFIFTWP